MPKVDEPIPNPDHAWRLLGMINEWIRHSDAKAGVTLAFTGVLGTMVFNLAKNFEHRTVVFDLLVALAVALLVLSAGQCAWTLTPRINDSDAAPEDVNRLFFGSISANFQGTRMQYRDALSSLTSDPAELISDLSDQIHANAKIATIKATHAKQAIRSALGAGLVVAALAAFISFMTC